MSEPEPNSVGLFAFPISDPPLRFHRFVFDYGHELGRAGGDLVLWRPIGDPAQHDDAYHRLRTSALGERDQRDSREFKAKVRQLGSENWTCQREYERYAKALGVQRVAPPLVVFTAEPLREKAMLMIESVVFDKPEWTRMLASILRQTLTAAAFSRLRKAGVFTDETMEAVQKYLWTVGEKIHRIHAGPRRKLPDSLKIGFSRSRLTEQIESSRDTKMHWWLRKDGSLAVDTVSCGKVDGKAEFPLVKRAATKEHRLLMMLAAAYPESVTLGDVLREVYPDVFEGNDPKEMRRAINRVRALVNATRKKLRASGIPAGVLPSVTLDADLRYALRLNVAKAFEADKRDPEGFLIEST